MIAQRPVVIFVNKVRGGVKGRLIDPLLGVLLGATPIIIYVEVPMWWFCSPQNAWGIYNTEDLKEITKEKPDLTKATTEPYMRSEEFADFVFRGFLEAIDKADPSIDLEAVKLIVLEDGWEFTQVISEKFKLPFGNAAVCDEDGMRISYPFNAPIDELGITERTNNVLDKMGIGFIRDLTSFNPAELLENGINEQTLDEIKKALAGRDLEFEG